jgi:hypothetical protein
MASREPPSKEEAMPDVWATVAALDRPTQERLAAVLETRGADPVQREMRRRFLDGVEFPAGADVLEVGCGTGVLTRVLAALPEVVARKPDRSPLRSRTSPLGSGHTVRDLGTAGSHL